MDQPAGTPRLAESAGPTDHDQLLPLVASLGWGVHFSLTRIRHGGNNRSFLVELDERRVLAKFYFRDERDTRDRLGTEFRFTHFAWRSGIRAVPEPFACDEEAGIALYEFVEGKPLEPGEVTWAEVQLAARFYRELNTPERRKDGAGLAAGSEACFSLSQHLERIGARVGRLSDIAPGSELDSEAVRFTQDELAPLWRRVRERIENRPDLNTPVEARLSPSDFGFHNAILEERGQLRFIDFEYAGWDDPAKLVCDFFCQPKVPVPREFFPRFAAEVAAEFQDSPAEMARYSALWPAYMVKWCCIMLNEFLPLGLARRQFAQDTGQAEERKARQLVLARESGQRALKLIENQ